MYRDQIESLRHQKRTTARADSDIRAEIQEEINDLEGWLASELTV